MRHPGQVYSLYFTHHLKLETVRHEYNITHTRLLFFWEIAALKGVIIAMPPILPTFSAILATYGANIAP